VSRAGPGPVAALRRAGAGRGPVIAPDGPGLAAGRPGQGLVAALRGAAVAAGAARLPLPGGPARWERTNHRGHTVSLRSGPALSLAVVAGAALPQPAAAVVGLAGGLLGAYDDVAGATAPQRGAKGLRGHVGALRQGHVTAGAVKLVGLSAAGVGGLALLPGRPPPVDVLLGAGVVAGSANLVNLLDLRPGRALKVGLAGAVALRQPGVAAAVAVLLPDDLRERTMLGDAGANALGAVLGLALVERMTSRTATAGALGVLAALTVASELVSFSRVIDAVAPLRALDRLGRAT